MPQEGRGVQDANRIRIIFEALDWANEMNPQDTDGTWLEDLTVQVDPYIGSGACRNMALHDSLLEAVVREYGLGGLDHCPNASYVFPNLLGCD